jgi:hypothetical protein
VDGGPTGEDCQEADRYASIKFMIYTLIGSVVMLLGILMLYWQHFSQFQSYSFEVADLMRLPPPLPADSGRVATFGTPGRKARSWASRPLPTTYRRTFRTPAPMATDSTREGLLDGMRKRHSYGATDNIILDYRMQTDGKEYLQCDAVNVPGEFKLIVKVIGTMPIRQIDIVKNNKFLHNRQPLEKEASFTFVDNQAGPGDSYYYVRVIQVDDQMAWSSPIWVTR